MNIQQHSTAPNNMIDSLQIGINGNTYVPSKREVCFLIGPPCSGKGTLAGKFNAPPRSSYSASAEIRRFIREQGLREEEQKMKEGELVSFPKIVSKVLRWQLQDFCAHREFGLFDGFGRVEQEVRLIGAMLFDNPTFDILGTVIFLDAPEDVLRQRNEDRGRDDDRHAIERRIQIYLENRQSVMDAVAKIKGVRSHTIRTEKTPPDNVAHEVFEFMNS